MSQAKITLRPPPNVEFVQGYPGIPSAGPDRPQAAVKGTIELRLGSQGVKAKWVRVELRKVETLPGGGQANTFYDYVGQSPVSIWQADEEWGVLQTRDFSFNIRIPESIPPSIALEKNAGIKYELIATVCIKGKTGFLRRSSSPTLTSMAPVIIDKHELHSTWPVYAQPESRHVVSDALTLTIDRTHTCYGPGDRVAVLATLKSDSLSTVVLRAFEFTLKETIIFRAGPHVSGKKGGPLVKVSPIGEQKVPVNATLFGGTQHKAELACIIPVTHTTTTVNAARHIDIGYMISVKAVMATGNPLLMDLPVTISNWPRTVSMEAVRRIGPSPNLSLIPGQHVHPMTEPTQTTQSSPPAQPAYPKPYDSPTSHTMQAKISAAQLRPHSAVEKVSPNSVWDGTAWPYDRQDGLSGGYGGRGGFDEFGYPLLNGGTSPPTQATFGGYGPSGHSSYNQQPIQMSTATQGRVTSTPVAETYGRRPRSATSTVASNNPQNRFTVVNMTGDVDDAEETPPTTSTASRFPSAAEEKRLLQASMQDARSRSTSASSSHIVTQSRQLVSQTPPQVAPSATPQPAAVEQLSTSPAFNSSRSAWPTAEEEKQQLFNKAKADAEKVQSSLVSAQPFGNSHSGADAGSSSVIHAPAPTASLKPPWPTAEEEKLRLFNEAQDAVRRTQGLAGNSPSPTTVGHARASSNASNPTDHFIGSSSGPHYKTSTTTTPPRSHVAYDALPSVSQGAKLYQHAMASVNRSSSAQAVSAAPHDTFSRAIPTIDRHSSLQPLARPQGTASPKHSPPAGRSTFPTAEEEKAAMRYHEAKRAVDRRQNTGFSESDHASGSIAPADDPIAYDALFPAEVHNHHCSRPVNNGSKSAPACFPANESFASHQGNQTYSLRDGASTRSLVDGTVSFLPALTPPASPPPVTTPPLPTNDALSEKERLRRKYESEDAATAVTVIAGPSIAPQQPTPPAGPEPAKLASAPPGYVSQPASRSQPLPPITSARSKPLTAAEEKARLRAQYEAHDAAAGSSSGTGASPSPPLSSTPPPLPGSVHSPSTSSFQIGVVISHSPTIPYAQERSCPNEEFVTPPLPPPLMPRPPVEYIQETQEQDALTQAEEHIYLQVDPQATGAKAPWERETSSIDFSLSFRPFSPLDLSSLGIEPVGGLDLGPSYTAAPPPLPPKLPLNGTTLF